jgi:hypothetical protein
MIVSGKWMKVNGCFASWRAGVQGFPSIFHSNIDPKRNFVCQDVCRITSSLVLSAPRKNKKLEAIAHKTIPCGVVFSLTRVFTQLQSTLFVKTSVVLVEAQRQSSQLFLACSKAQWPKNHRNYDTSLSLSTKSLRAKDGIHFESCGWAIKVTFLTSESFYKSTFSDWNWKLRPGIPSPILRLLFDCHLQRGYECNSKKSGDIDGYINVSGNLNVSVQNIEKAGAKRKISILLEILSFSHCFEITAK